MTPDEYDAARAALGWSHAELARTIGVSPRVPYRYANGQVEIPEPAARLLRALVLLRLTESAAKFNAIIEEIRNHERRP